MRSPLVPTLLAAAVLIAAPARAQQQQRFPWAEDARLNKPVTVRWKKATLYDALKELSKATGVHLVPERTLVDEPVMASATNAPARQVLEQMGRLLHFTWVKNGGTAAAPHYLLVQDRAAKDEEDREINGARRAVLEALEKELARLRRVSQMSPEAVQRDLEKADQELGSLFSGGLAAASTDPRMGQRMLEGMGLRAVSSPSGRAMLDVIDGLTPAQWQGLMGEPSRSVVFSSQPGEGELPLPGGLHDRLRSAAPGFPFPKALFQSLGPQVEQGISKAEEMMRNQWGRASGFRVSVDLSLNLGASPVGMLRAAPEPLGLEPAAQGMAPLFALSGLNMIGAPVYFAEPTEDPALREQRLAADPVLGKKAKLKLPPLTPQTGFLAILGKSYRVAEILPEVEAAYGIHLVGDAYNRQALGVIPPPGDAELPLYKVLDQMAGILRTWERDGDVIRLRSKTWAHDRRSEIPVRYMQRWLAVREKRGGFSLDDLAEIAALLRDAQVESLMYSAMEAGTQDFTDFVMVGMNREILRFWGRLLPMQRTMLRRGQKLPVRALYPFQQRLLLGLNDRQKQQSMFAAFMGGKPPRRPELMEAAELSVEHRGLGAPGAAKTPGAPPAPAARSGVTVRVSPGPGPGVSATAGPIAGMRTPNTVYVIRLAFPDGQKDEFTIPLTASKPPAEK